MSDINPQPEQTTVTNSEPMGYSPDELATLASQPMNAAPAAAETVEGGEETPDDTDDAGGEDDTPDEQGEETPEVDAAPVKKGRKTAADHIAKLRAEKHAERAEKEALRRELEEARETNKKLKQFFEKVTAQPEEPEEEIIDTALDKKVKKLEQRIEEKDSAAVVKDYQREMAHADTIGKQTLTDYESATQYLIASEAYVAIERAAIAGKELSPDEALIKAQQKLAKEMFEIYTDGGDAEKLAKYVYKTAASRGFKAGSGKPKAKVNMAAVREARETAGAPAIKKESVVVGNIADWTQDIAVKAKEKYGSTSDSYLRSMGL